MGELILDPEVIQVIDNYMDDSKPKIAGLERICINKMCDMAENVIMGLSIKSMLRLKGEPQINDIFAPKHKAYFQGSSWYQYSWWSGRQRFGLTYFIHGKCERYFEDNSEKFIMKFLHDTYGTIENSVLQTDGFMWLAEEFEQWFDERRKGFLKEMDAAIAEIKKFKISEKPQSHGGVANLLKVITKTMEKQGADITNIAKVQYAVCIQAGIYIPDEFVQDVAVAMDVLEDKEKQE